MPYLQELIRNDFREVKKVQKDIERTIFKQAKVRLMAYKGFLNPYLTQDELIDAKRFGILPDRYNVHHIIPLCCKNTSYECDNLTICDKSLHQWLHTNIYNPVLSKMNTGDKVYIILPEWKPVNTFKNFDKELKLFYEMNRNNRFKNIKFFNIERIRDR